MTVKELKEALKDIPDDDRVTIVTDGYNPYDDYWDVKNGIRITNVVTNDNDRICFLSE